MTNRTVEEGPSPARQRAINANGRARFERRSRDATNTWWRQNERRMASLSRSTVVVIRAWLDDDGVRGRVLFEDDEDLGASAVAASIEEMCELARTALER